MYYVLYYLKGKADCQKKDGFSSRENAWRWIEKFIDEVDWYSICESEERYPEGMHPSIKDVID